MCGKTEHWAGPSTALFQCLLCSVASPRTTQTHICIIHLTLLYFTVRCFTLLYLLYSFKTRLVINPVLDNPELAYFHSTTNPELATLLLQYD